jgi:hypothetical protein
MDTRASITAATRAGKPPGDGGPAPPRTPAVREMLAELLPLIAVVVVAGRPPSYCSRASSCLPWPSPDRSR